jgi:surfeit locus 1 family protein
MHQKMSIIKIKNWKLTILGLIVVSLLASLGYWQLSRWQQKTALLASFQSRTTHTPLTNTALQTPGDWRFYRATLTGTFDNKHTLLLDNKTYKKQVGYEVYTPFHMHGHNAILLVDRGFVPMGADRNILPTIKPITGNVTIKGMFNLPPTYVAFGGIIDSKKISWPLRIEFIQLPAIGKIINSTLYPYTLTLEPTSPYALSTSAIEWNIFTVSPERHLGYAFQWFALALTLLVICVVLNRRE